MNSQSCFFQYNDVIVAIVLSIVLSRISSAGKEFIIPLRDQWDGPDETAKKVIFIFI